ncbi:MAG: RHS repeat-associated core domain-containing protein, partial [candidate division Zixibacteria bacterium]|nr:RHS repeat-associated core domain-containing protein [candidate division Zixibacteria bacterium]
MVPAGNRHREELTSFLSILLLLKHIQQQQNQLNWMLFLLGPELWRAFFEEGEGDDYGPFGDVLDGEHRWGWDYNGNHHMGFDSVGFTGYRIDAESGLYHAPFREYDPLVANWTTSDPIKSGELWYAYCGNNPVRFTDPFGLEKAPLCAHQGRFDFIIKIPGVETGEEWYNAVIDTILAGGAGVWNLFATIINAGTNTVGETLSLADKGLTALDDVIPYEWTLTGMGFKEDLFVIGLFAGMHAIELDATLEAMRAEKLMRIFTS